MNIDLWITARFETPFHIGSGVAGETALIKPLLKAARGDPYLPGSALKGVLRHEAERIVRALTDSEAACRSPRAETMCPQWNPSTVGYTNEREESFCPVCCAFGSPAYPSPFLFGDLQAEVEDSEAITPTDLRYGVSVSRYRGAAAEQRLYMTEVASAAPMIPLEGHIEGHLSDSMGKGPLALLLAAIGALQMIGGGRSRGLGWLNLEVSQPPLDPSQTRKELKVWLSINS